MVKLPIRTVRGVVIGLLSAGLMLEIPGAGVGWSKAHSSLFLSPKIATQNQETTSPKSPGALVATSNTLPYFRHVFVIMLENHSYADTWYEHDMPYLHQLARTYGLPTQMYGITNPTVPNRVGLLSGRGRSIGDNVKAGQLSYPNLIDQLQQHHLTWGAYYQHTETSSNQHPVYNFSQSTLLRFQDIYDNSARRARLLPLPDLESALKDNTVPNFTWIAPNFLTNSHGTARPGPYQYTFQGAGPGGSAGNDTRLENLANAFLKHWIPRIIHSKAWKSGPSAIFITEDETSYDASMPQNGNWASNLGTTGSPSVAAGTILGGNPRFPFPGGINGGGRIPAVVLTNVAKHVVSSQPFNQFSILKTIESAWHLGYLGHAANPQVKTMSVFFHGGAKPAGVSSTPWSRPTAPVPTTRDQWTATPAVPALPPKQTSSLDAIILPSADPHISLGASGQAAASLAVFVTNHASSLSKNLSLTLTQSSGVTFSHRSSPVGSTQVANADETATQFGPSVVGSHTISLPIAAVGQVPETLDITGLLLNAAPNAATGPVKVKVSAGSVQLGTVVLATVGRPKQRTRPNLLAPIIRPGTIQIRFQTPGCETPGCSSGRQYEIEIAGQNPQTATHPNINEHAILYTHSHSLIITDFTAELTSLAGKLYWVRVRSAGHSSQKSPAHSEWSLPLPFSVLPGPLPSGVS